jgi:hypothetical protein
MGVEGVVEGGPAAQAVPAPPCWKRPGGREAAPALRHGARDRGLPTRASRYFSHCQVLPDPDATAV